MLIERPSGGFSDRDIVSILRELDSRVALLEERVKELEEDLAKRPYVGIDFSSCHTRT